MATAGDGGTAIFDDLPPSSPDSDSDDDFRIEPATLPPVDSVPEGGAVPAEAEEVPAEAGEQECFLCDTFRGSQPELEAHIQEAHVCTECDEMASDLKAHCLEKAHFSCPYCSVSYCTNTEYWEHLKECNAASDLPLEVDEQPRHSCPVCDKDLSGLSLEARQVHEEECGLPTEGDGDVSKERRSSLRQRATRSRRRASLPSRPPTISPRSKPFPPSAPSSTSGGGLEAAVEVGSEAGAAKRRRVSECGEEEAGGVGASLGGSGAAVATGDSVDACCFCQRKLSDDEPPLIEFHHNGETVRCHEVCAAFCPSVRWIRCRPLCDAEVVRGARAAASIPCTACALVGQDARARYGATLRCQVEGCARRFHLPCARELAERRQVRFVYSGVTDARSGESTCGIYCWEHVGRHVTAGWETEEELVAGESNGGSVSRAGLWFEGLRGGWRQLAHGVIYHPPGRTDPLAEPLTVDAAAGGAGGLRVLLGMRLWKAAVPRFRTAHEEWEKEKMRAKTKKTAGPSDIELIVDAAAEEVVCPACGGEPPVCFCCAAIRHLVCGSNRKKTLHPKDLDKQALASTGEAVVEVRRVGMDDPRTTLRGRLCVVARQPIPRGTVIMMYQGMQCTESQYRDLIRKGDKLPAAFANDVAAWQSHLDNFAFEMVAANSHRTKNNDKLVVTPYELEAAGEGGYRCVFSGNAACHINDPAVNVDLESHKEWRPLMLAKGCLERSRVEVVKHFHQPREFGNVRVLEFSVCGWPLPFVVACAEIEAGRELLMSYGNDFWQSCERTARVQAADATGADHTERSAGASAHSLATDRLPHFLRNAVTDAGLDDDFWEEDEEDAVVEAAVRPCMRNAGAVVQIEEEEEEREAALDTAKEFGQRSLWRYAEAGEAEARKGLSWRQVAEREGPGTATGPNSIVAPTLAAAPSTAMPPPQQQQQQQQQQQLRRAAPSATAPAPSAPGPGGRRNIRQHALASSAALARPLGKAGGLYEKLRANKSARGGAK